MEENIVRHFYMNQVLSTFFTQDGVAHFEDYKIIQWMKIEKLSPSCWSESRGRTEKSHQARREKQLHQTWLIIAVALPHEVQIAVNYNLM